ncbi:MAG TPA: alpha/beta hydrolase [Candidatus Binataceae bacterium]|nr:alpha/beta hydrolase [Candidatus Binataceae bacterium]
MAEFAHKFADTNGIRMHYVEAGAGPLVLMCHGWPESWYSWRHQIRALADAGFRAVAPDQRGYGQTDAPQAVESYNIFNLTGDIVGLLNSLDVSSAVVVGHDWGAPVAWNCALLRPDLFRASGLLSVPYVANPKARGMRPSEMWKLIEGTNLRFYQNYFQGSDAERDFEADVRRSMKAVLYGASGDAPPGGRFEHLFPRSQRLLDNIKVPDKLPAWLTEADLDFFTAEFTRTGFRGGFNWYRNFDRNWELSGFLAGAKLMQPSLFAAGEHDVVLRMIPNNALAQVDATMPNCRSKTIIPGAGHWIQQERPQEINELLLKFLTGL